MPAYLRLWGATGLLAALLMAAPAWGQAIPPFNRDAPPGDAPPVPEVDARGPIHEGFAQPNGLPPRAGPVVPKAPPQDLPELPPDERPEGDVVWVPGYWAFDEDRKDFVWVSGFWRLPPAGRKWVPGYWVEAPGGARWVSGFWADASRTEVPYLDQPPEPLDFGPSIPAPDDSYFYVPGTWAPIDGRWGWRAGFWCAPRAGLVYTPARILWTPRGFLYSAPFWDRPWDRRGVLFAPVYLRQGTWTRPGWTFRPSVVINPAVALGSLWVRPGAGYYAFGDFYGATYARRGFQPWATYGPRARDPLFNYYANSNRNWQRDLVATYRDRAAGRAALPPRTLAAQERARPAQRAVQPLSDFRSDSLRLTKVTPAERRSVDKLTTAYRQASVARRTEEVRPLPSGVRPGPLSLTRVPTPPASRPGRLDSPRVMTPGLTRPDATAPRLTTPTAPMPPLRRGDAPPRATTPPPRGTTPPPRTTTPPRPGAPRTTAPPRTTSTPPRRPEAAASRLRAPEGPRGAAPPPARTQLPPRTTAPNVTAPRPSAPPARPGRLSPQLRSEAPRASSLPRMTSPAPRSAPRMSSPAPRMSSPAPRSSPRMSSPAPRPAPRSSARMSAPAPRPAPRMAAPSRSRPSSPARSAPPARGGRPDRGR